MRGLARRFVAKGWRGLTDKEIMENDAVLLEEIARLESLIAAKANLPWRRAAWVAVRFLPPPLVAWAVAWSVVALADKPLETGVALFWLVYFFGGVLWPGFLALVGDSIDAFQWPE